MGQSQGSSRFEDWDFVQKVHMAQFSTVWRAVHRQSGDVAAVKQTGISRRKYAQGEISMLRAVSHPNIIRLHSVFEDQESIYLALEYFNGSLADRVKECGLGLKEAGVQEWTQQMLSAVAYLHSESICHRHITPDSFMMHQGFLKLSDFCLALYLHKGELLSEKCGIPAFMAPEQHMRKGYAHPCDVWATGVTMFLVMLGGKHPFFTGGGQLCEKRLLEGTLDFNYPVHVFGFAALSKERFSEPARQLCRKMVEPITAKRVSAEVALQDPWLRCASEARGALGELPVSRDGAVAQPASSPAARANDGVLSTPATERSAASRKGSKESAGWWARSGMENSPPNVPQPATERSATGRKGSKESTGWWSRAGVENTSPNIQAPVSRIVSGEVAKDLTGWLQRSPPSTQQPVRRPERKVTIAGLPSNSCSAAESELKGAGARTERRCKTASGSEVGVPSNSSQSAGWWQFGAAEASPQNVQRRARPLHRPERQASIESECATRPTDASSRRSSSSWWPLSSAENSDPNAQPAAYQWPVVAAKRHLSFETALEF